MQVFALNPRTGETYNFRAISSPAIRQVLFTLQFVLLLGVAIVFLPLFAAAGIPPRADRATQQARSGQSSSHNPQTVSEQNMERNSALLQTDKLPGRPLLITYENGELTIDADEVPLSAILSEVRKVLGADIQIPAGSSDQHMWVQFGPGPARRILRDLFDGTDLDYVIQASDKDEDGVLSVFLTARGKTETGLARNAAAMAVRRSTQPVSLAPVESSEPDSPAASENAAASQPAPASPASADPRPTISTLQPGQRAPSPIPSTPLVGTAEQMAQQLQNMYQLRKQLQIQENQTQKFPNR